MSKHLTQPSWPECRVSLPYLEKSQICLASWSFHIRDVRLYQVLKVQSRVTCWGPSHTCITWIKSEICVAHIVHINHDARRFEHHKSWKHNDKNEHFTRFVNIGHSRFIFSVGWDVQMLDKCSLLCYSGLYLLLFPREISSEDDQSLHLQR